MCYHRTICHRTFRHMDILSQIFCHTDILTHRPFVTGDFVTWAFCYRTFRHRIFCHGTFRHRHSYMEILSQDISSQTLLWWIACNLGILSVLTVLAYDCKMASRENRSNVGPTWRSSGSVLCLSEILTSYVIRLFEISIFTEFKGGISKYRHPALRHWGTPAPILKLLNCRFLIFHA